MSFSRTYSFQAEPQLAHPITIDVDNHGVQPKISLVGLPDKATTESKERVYTALRNQSELSVIRKMGSITVSLAPAETPKHGPAFDLPIAIGILKSMRMVFEREQKSAYVGELGLDGTVRKIRGVLSIAEAARKSGIVDLYVPFENAVEAALVEGIRIFPVRTLTEIIRHLKKQEDPARKNIEMQTETVYVPKEENGGLFESIIGQETAKRALTIAAAGGHNVALFGPPGTGKTMLAKALTEILPSLSKEEMLESTQIHSVAGTLQANYLSLPPFRAPHHTSSTVSIIGGGQQLRPGEVVLAHNGVLFLDEFPEFQKSTIDALREPLEDGVVRITRAKGTATYPTSFILIVAMNPCPCGYLGDQQKSCSCNMSRIESYRKKLSGPIIDRIDMWIEVPRIPHEVLFSNKASSSTLSKTKLSIKRALLFGSNRQGPLLKNARIKSKDIKKYAPLHQEVEHILIEYGNRLNLSPRAIHRTVRLARTIADLAEEEHITRAHILEALSYRKRD